VFTYDAANLVVNDTNGFRDIFIHNRQATTTFRVSVDRAGMPTNDDSFLAAISGNGLVVAFESDADNLVADDLNVARDIFVNLQRFAPLITSANSATFTVGNAGVFTVLTTGTPVPTLSVSGALPAGVSFTDNGNGTATIAGTPATGSGGVYVLTLTASNGVAPDATQVFTLTVQETPAITSAASVAFVVGASGTFTVSATGFPAPTLNVSGALPAGVSFTDNGNGTATISGIPAIGSAGNYTPTITASNGLTPDARQTFTLTVGGPTQVLAITSASSTTFIAGQPGSFTVTAIGFPPPALSYSGALPPGVVFTDNGDGTATLSGTPTRTGSFPLVITASDGVGPSIIQRFTLRVYATQVFLPLIRQ